MEGPLGAAVLWGGCALGPTSFIAKGPHPQHSWVGSGRVGGSLGTGVYDKDKAVGFVSYADVGSGGAGPREGAGSSAGDN